jgi:hypothetical protein
MLKQPINIGLTGKFFVILVASNFWLDEPESDTGEIHTGNYKPEERNSHMLETQRQQNREVG